MFLVIKQCFMTRNILDIVAGDVSLKIVCGRIDAAECDRIFSYAQPLRHG